MSIVPALEAGTSIAVTFELTGARLAVTCASGEDVRKLLGSDTVDTFTGASRHLLRDFQALSNPTP